ncbi:shieldin complex subunit 1 isoform X5 [Vicugna pacos]|uniref:Shieldin complex subunit 1 isoform X5 n=1 Tax=Vicugna pacos TaxID=30538 RepID=A0ABM5BTC5_VICPA
MAAQEATPDGQSEESSALDLPSVYDIRDYVLQRPSQEANSEALGSAEALSMPCSSDVDPALLSSFKVTCCGRRDQFTSVYSACKYSF